MIVSSLFVVLCVWVLIPEEIKDTRLMNLLFWSFGTTQLRVTDVELNEVTVTWVGMQASVKINTKIHDECVFTNTYEG